MIITNPKQGPPYVQESNMEDLHDDIINSFTFYFSSLPCSPFFSGKGSWLALFSARKTFQGCQTTYAFLLMWLLTCSTLEKNMFNASRTYLSTKVRIFIALVTLFGYEVFYSWIIYFYSYYLSFFSHRIENK